MKKLLLIMVSVLLVVSFAGCDLFMSKVEVSDDVVVESRGGKSDASSKSGKPTEFTAQIELLQVPNPSATVKIGEGPHWSTDGEILVGGVEVDLVDDTSIIYGGVVSVEGWPELEGAVVSVENRTEFNSTPNIQDFYGYLVPGYIKGVNHSDITLTLTSGETVTLKAHGSVEGQYPVSAAVEMNFNSNDGDTHMNGSLTGSFDWYYLQSLATASFTLSGTYK